MPGRVSVRLTLIGSFSMKAKSVKLNLYIENSHPELFGASFFKMISPYVDLSKAITPLFYPNVRKL
jgi:hypothetical protein